MTKMSLALIAIAMVALVAASGCLSPETGAIDTAKLDPAIADFLAKNVRAKISVATWTEADSKNRLDYLVEKCGPSINPTDFFYVLVEQEDRTAEAWIYQRVPRIACVRTSYDMCVSTPDCEDGDLCTIDKCVGIPKQCSRERINECVGGDGCCPQGCTSNVDFDCAPDECSVHADCDDGDPGTADYCQGIPKKCVYEDIVDCVEGDNFCPSGCNYGSDKDCTVGECENDSDCDDGDDSTTDYCDGIPTECWHQKKTLCIDNDNYCPSRCTYKTDNDCEAQAGNSQRITVECNGYKTDLDADVLLYGDELNARFDERVSHANNGGLIYYKFEGYTYNNKDGETPIVESITVQGKAFFEKGENESYLQLNVNGLHYDVELLSGVPVTELESNEKPFVAGNDDKIPIVLFGTDSLLVAADMTAGNEYIEVLSGYIERAVQADGIVESIIGKNKRSHTIQISGCYERNAVFSLYDGDELVESQTASTGDLLFEDLLQKNVRINYLHRDSTTGRCDYRYATGTIEKIYSGQEYPAGSGSDWLAKLSFEDRKLKKITFEKTDVGVDSPITSGGEILILPSEETGGFGFCTLDFFGLVR